MLRWPDGWPAVLLGAGACEVLSRILARRRPSGVHQDGTITV